MLQGASIGITGSAVEQFLIAGYEQQDCDDSDTIRKLKRVKKSYPSVGGAFIWNFGGMAGCAAQVASDLKSVF
jgi:hypothetical protein